MMAYYQIKKRVGYYRIGSPENVFSYLVVGTERAALIDTGYGFGDLKAAVETVTPASAHHHQHPRPLRPHGRKRPV